MLGEHVLTYSEFIPYQETVLKMKVKFHNGYIFNKKSGKKLNYIKFINYIKLQLY